jgi:hypothetical protein
LDRGLGRYVFRVVLSHPSTLALRQAVRA